jgi:dTDP-4-amino-4,6-dideoxygalactose transaminase
MYVARSPVRDRIATALREAKIGYATYYTTPLHLQPVFQTLGYEPGSLPETERAARETIALPLWAGISSAQQEEVVATIRAAVETGATREVA